MTDVRLRALQRVPRGSGSPTDPHHVVYSRRWMAAGVVSTVAGVGGLVASLPPYRHWLGRRVVAGLATLGATLALGAALGIWRLQVERHTLVAGGWPQNLAGLRIAHLSDFHLGPPHSRAVLRRALQAVADFQPDLICLTGDFVDTLANLPLLRAMLKDIAAPLGVFACLGNHDYWDDPAAIALALAELGIAVLVNEHRVVERQGARLVVAGVADPWQANADLDATLLEAPADLPVLLLAHCPDYILTAAKRGVALQLSGHAHAGHINLPLLGPLVLPRWGLLYPHGRFQIAQSCLYVSRGIGGLPVRLGATPEVGLLTVIGQD